MYNALEKIRKVNNEKYKIDGPIVPQVLTDVSELEKHSIRFIRDLCEDLRFDNRYKNLDDLEGKSLKKGQIPYNMEKDIDRFCLENAMHKFLKTGSAKDAFDIYYIYIEMFLGKYNKSRKIIEMLSEFESNASALLMKHRDHYSHSVYVFLIGLAIYESCSNYRDEYNKKYGIKGKEASHHFLKYWGLTSLFHDIGYPFELPFEEVKTYFNNKTDNVPYICYQNMDKYISLSDKEKEILGKVFNKKIEKSTDILAERISECFSKEYGDRSRLKKILEVERLSFSEYIKKVFEYKSKDPNVFGGYVDHAYFSASVLMKNILEIVNDDLNIAHIDSFVAIILHNSIFKFIIQREDMDDFDKTKYALKVSIHPLAYLLMLCDELQCWDRTSYGQTSRKEVHAMACDFIFEENSITANYKFDKSMEAKANRKNAEGKLVVGGTYGKIVNNKFLKDIEKIVRINENDSIKLIVNAEFIVNNKYSRTFLSESNYMHLYDLAVILSGRNDKNLDLDNADKDIEFRKKLEEKFDTKSLEYKLIDISRVKEFARHLDAINCFYTDRPVSYPLLTEFNDEQIEKIGPLEHERWLDVHYDMGWKFNDKYDVLEKEFGYDKDHIIRECTRTHKLMIDKDNYTHEDAIRHYDELPDSEKLKDKEPMNKLLKIMETMDGVRFYKK